MLTEKLSTSDSELECIKEVSVNKQLANLKYVCKFGECGKRFKRETYLDRHEFHHDGIKKHVCLYDNCEKSYIISTHLKRHVQTFHEKYRKEKKFKCTIANCNKQFDSLYNVERHVTSTHQNSKTYTCKSCGKSFSRKLTMRRHEIMQHNGEYPYRCNVCNKGYIQETHLKKHKCLQKEALYKCERCNNAFTKWSLLIEHSKSEHERAIMCSCCGREFHRKIDLQNHENSVKKKQESENTKIECPYEGCDRIYNFRKNLNHHIKVKHLCKKYKCPIEECGKELATKQKLNLHIEKMHKMNKKVLKKDKTKIKKRRRTRKDAGQPKRSFASRLSNVVFNNLIEKTVLSKETGEIEVTKDTDVLQPEVENNEKIAGSVVTLELDNF
ncbi:zinc finger protein 85 [Condylostylus longicornis]|uniref:zinc finger protein 85 n=1 Tax=Condylostylus longicornis TaxID=2530218 RepID=UPI00244DD3EE|nr:zinc finger protein 85 [Condylostylus longicornis]